MDEENKDAPPQPVEAMTFTIDAATLEAMQVDEATGLLRMDVYEGDVDGFFEYMRKIYGE